MRIRSVLLLGLAVACGSNSAPVAGHPPSPSRVAPPSPQAASPSEGEKLPPIVVDLPQEGAEVTSPVTVEGSADVFEATVGMRIVASDGEVLVRTFTTATCGSGCRGDFSKAIPFDVDERTDAVIEVFEPPVTEEGRPPPLVRVPVVLLP